jgi:polyhydroxybutyrate depolymerase
MSTWRVRVVLLQCGLLSALGLSGCGGSVLPAASSAPTCAVLDVSAVRAGDFTQGFEFEGLCREYRLHVPPSYDGARPVPLLIAMHGSGGTAEGMEWGTGLSAKADWAGFVAVYPQGPQGQWSLGQDSPDSRYLRELIAHLSARVSLDRRRIYVTGHSLGGGMADRAACDLADVVAASAPVEGYYQGQGVCNPVRPVPVLAFHGTADDVVPHPDGWIAAWASRDGCDPTPVTTASGNTTETTWPHCRGDAEVRLVMVQDLGHQWWGGANDPMWEFFAKHPLPE